MKIHKYTDRSSQKAPVKYVTGAEVRRTVIVASDLFEADSSGRVIVEPGQLLVRADSGPYENQYGPYDKEASDGRQTLGAPGPGNIQVVITAEWANFHPHGPKGIGAYFHNAVFDLSELTLDGATASAVASAMPTCIFDD